MVFKNRGHFCNYCRKIVFNKCPDYYHPFINPAIWYVWDTKNIELMHAFIRDLANLELKEKTKVFNLQLKAIRDKYIKVVV